MMMVNTLEDALDFFDDRRLGGVVLWPFFSLVCVMLSIPRACW